MRSRSAQGLRGPGLAASLVVLGGMALVTLARVVLLVIASLVGT